jgi:hypothetical protein
MSAPQQPQPQQAASQPHITPPPPAHASASTSTPAPPPAPPPALAPTSTQHAATTEPESLNASLNAIERFWKFKLAGYTICLISGLIGLGTFGWATSKSTAASVHSDFSDDSAWALPWPLITFGISVVWSFLVIAITLLRKRPVHPGLRVSMDLLLWLGYIGTVLLALFSFMEILNWGRYGVIDSYYYYSSSSRGQYELADNGTWVWDQDSSSSSLSYPRDCTRSSRISYYDQVPFASCEEQDAYINALWKAKPHRMDVVLTGVVCQFLNLVLHFALFVWACIDTNRRNRTKVSKDAEKIAAGIVEKMIASGSVVRAPMATYAAPHQQQMQYGFPPQQQGQMMYPHPQMQQTSMPQQGYAPASASASTPAPAAVAAAQARRSTKMNFGPRFA